MSFLSSLVHGFSRSTQHSVFPSPLGPLRIGAQSFPWTAWAGEGQEGSHQA